jgi:L,D-peptidoglycan transpeptidase YkuD (ErfK/YbiS/YcfS/YnhG family)
MDLRVTMRGGQAVLDWGAGARRAAIGPGGIAVKGGEGDGITPRGRWPVRGIFYRADRIARPDVTLPLRVIRPDDGWCDAPDDANYNRLVRLPYRASAEHLWRDDGLYDLVAVLGFNDDPVVAGKGSAIFLHLARSVGESRSDNSKEPDYSATHGCVALAFADALAALEQLRPGDAVIVE